MLKSLLVILLVIVVAVPVALALIGRERAWSLIAGSADLGRYDFAAGRRRDTPNDALACTQGACASPDVVIPATTLSPAAAIEAAESRLRGIERFTERVDDRSDPDYARFVVRTPLMRFPDTIDVLADASAAGETWIKAYSRSQLGRSDLGANRNRLQRLFGEPL